MMKHVKKGDIIIHSYNKDIRAISIAKTDCYSANRPMELADVWNNDGWKVDTEYYYFRNCIITSEHKDKLLELQPGYNAPFNINGRGNTGYLFAASKKMYEYIIRETAKIQQTKQESDEILALINDTDHRDNLNDIVDDFAIKSIKDADFLNTEGGFSYEPKPKVKGQIEIINKCEVDENHPTFIRKNIDVNYTEPHHLIPMAHSDKFDVSLDVEANIVSLCSNCHNHLHYGKNYEEVLRKLYDDRNKELSDAGIDIEFNDLLKMYLLSTTKKVK